MKSNSKHLSLFALLAFPCMVHAVTWTTFAERKNNVFSSEISPARLTAHMNANSDAIIHRHCADCSSESHRDIFYKRVTPVPDQATFDSDSGFAVDFVDLFVKNWASTPSNRLNEDFKLYSSYEDAVADVDAWTFCNYDDDWVGFPRDCGPTGFVPGQWNSIHSKTFTFEVTGEVPVLVDEPDVWTTFASKAGGVYSAEFSGAALAAHMNANPNAIIRRSCPQCWHSAHKIIYYKRLTPVPDQATFDADSGRATGFVSLLTANWWNTPSNTLNVDFKLYSTYEDAVLDNKGWTFCNYNSNDVGFPRDCGPDKAYGGQWINTKPWGKGFTFEVTGEVAKLVDDPEEWTTFASKAGTTISNPLSAARLVAHVNANGSIIRRLCPSCSNAEHKEIYYKRITPVPEQDAFTDARAVLDFVDLFTNNWMSSPDNKINKDFKLYSSYEDAVLDHRAWNRCNYDDAGVGFPRDCGRDRLIGHQWISAARSWSKDFVFEVEGKVLFYELDTVWTEVGSFTGGAFAENEDVTAESFAAHVEQEGAIVHRSCPSCADTHKDIFYKRITPVPSLSDFDGETPDNFLDLFTGSWFSTPSNQLNVDFKLYSSYDDAIEDVDAWTFCNYDEEHVGFPRECGPTALTAGQWSSTTSRTDGQDYILYVSGVVPLPAYNQWDVIASSANNVKKVELNDDILRQHLAATNGIIRRFCPSCWNPLHKEIYYKRISPLPAPSEFDGKTPEDFLDLFLNNWFDEPKNKLNEDFELYSTYLDARTGQNKWAFCNYNDATVGFPRDCGPQQMIPHGWNSMTQWSRDFSFEVEGSFEPIIQASSLPAATEWTVVVEATHTTKIKDYASEAHVMKHVADSTNGIIRRLCPSCADSHKEVYYRRLTSFPTADEYKTSGSAASSFMDMMISNWYSYPRNVLDTDFALFSTYQDALTGINAWNFCNYDHAGVGFPRDCGPSGFVGSQWTSFERNTGKLFSFAVEGIVPPEPQMAALAEMEGWTGVARKSAGIPYQCMSDSEFRTQMEATNGIVRRLCPQCTNHAHREIYYKRLTPIPDQSAFETSDAKNFLDLFLDNWMREPSNEVNVDFELYSTYDDALRGRNKWTFCNYDDGGVGFPRDCGPNGYVPSQWTSTSRRSPDFVFEVEGNFDTEEECKPPPKACVATGWGDPHMITFDGLKYDAHAIGEVIMMMSQDSDLMVQARLERVAGHAADPAATTGVAIRENPKTDGTEFPLVQVSMTSGEDPDLTLFSCPVELYVDEVKQDDLAAGYHANDVKVEVHMNTGRIHIEYPDLQLNLKVLKFMGLCHFTVTYALLNDCRPDEQIIGLLGSPDGNATNDWMKRDGSDVDLPAGGLSSFFFGPAYEYVTQNWCIYIENESLFTYQPGYNFSYYEHCGVEYNPELERSLEEATPEQIEVCGDNKACLLEAVNLGDGAADQSLETPGADEEEPPEIQVLKTESSEITTDLPDIVLEVPDTPPADGNCPVCRAIGWGDPHIITFDGVSYDVHVKGELTFLKSTDPTNDFTIQARTVAVKNHPRGPAVTSGVVVHKTGEPTIQVSLGENGSSELVTTFAVSDDACPVQLFVNGQARDITTGTGLTDATVQVKGDRIVVEYLDLQMRMDMRVRSWRNECHFSVTYFLADCPCDGSLVGILGQPDGEWSNDWHNHDGSAVDIPRSRRKRRGRDAYDYSLTWCLTAEDSHFEYEPEMSHEDFDKCTGNKGDENYDVDVDAIIDTAILETPEVIEKCTNDGVLDEGCVIECVYLGEGACDEYVDTVQSTQTADIPETPDETPVDTPDTTPDSTPDTDLPDLDEVGGNDPDDTPENENTSPNEGLEIPTETDTVAENTPASSLGDPHFRTWKNDHFEYHGQCDLMLAKDLKFADGLGIQVEIRTKLVRFWSYIKSAAIRIGDDILEVQGSAEPKDGIAEYWMNLEYQGSITSIGGFPITLTMRSRKKRSFMIDLGSKFPGEKIEISAYREFVKVDFINASEASFGNAVGMLGDLKTGKLLGRDGTTKVDDYLAFGAEWQVRPDEDMLFYRSEDPQFPKACVIPEDPQGERRRRLGEQSVDVKQAEAACAGLKNPLDRKDCVYDVLATQDLDMVGAF